MVVSEKNKKTVQILIVSDAKTHINVVVFHDFMPEHYMVMKRYERLKAASLILKFGLFSRTTILGDYYMKIHHELTVSKNILDLFQNHKYEHYVLYLMKKSQSVFPGEYEMAKEIDHEKWDFVEVNSNTKYDAKLPFLEKQMRLLTDGKRHEPKIEEWIKIMQDEASDFNPWNIRNNKDYDISETKLYNIMKKQILRDNVDEYIIFFLPYPISISINENIYLQSCTDYLKAIYNRLTDDICLTERKIYAIYPASEKNQFALRDLSTDNIELIICEELEKYFSYEVVNKPMEDLLETILFGSD